MIKPRKARAAPLVKTTEESGSDEDPTVVVQHKRAKEQPAAVEEVIVPGPEDEEEDIKLVSAAPGAAGAVAVEAEAKSKKQGKFGPTAASSYVRMTTFTDFKPELCKDYNQTGYCGFGDSCIYIHDRTTYVSGNELDRRWEELQKQKKASEAVEAKEATLTQICGVCQKALDKPVVKTRCAHLFHKTCAFNRFSKGQIDCANCHKPTSGVFNDVKDFAL